MGTFIKCLLSKVPLTQGEALETEAEEAPSHPPPAPAPTAAEAAGRTLISDFPN